MALSYVLNSNVGIYFHFFPEELKKSLESNGKEKEMLSYDNDVHNLLFHYSSNVIKTFSLKKESRKSHS